MTKSRYYQSQYLERESWNYSIIYEYCNLTIALDDIYEIDYRI